MSVDVKYDFKLVTSETITLGTNIPAQSLAYSINNTSGSILSGSTTTPITRVYAETISLAANVATLDLTALAYSSTDPAKIANVNFDGLKVQFIHIKNNGTGTLVVAEALTNGYFFLGATGDTVTLGIGGQLLMHTPEGLPNVASGAKDILFTGTGTETFDIHMVAG